MKALALAVTLLLAIPLIAIDTTKVRESEPPPATKKAPATAGPRYYTCPKDEAMLRVRPGTPERTFKCPIDGTVMRSGVGPGGQYFLLD